MFNSRDEYIEATENASINTYRNSRIKRKYRLGIFNLLLLTTIGVMGYVGFDSLNEKTHSTSSASDNELLELLGSIDINSMALASKDEPLSLSLAINSVVEEDTYVESDSIYTQALSREINGDKLRTVVIKEGDTLATLSQKYYGNSMAYDKIIRANKSLTQKSSTIFVGQELVLPY